MGIGHAIHHSTEPYLQERIQFTMNLALPFSDGVRLFGVDARIGVFLLDNVRLQQLSMSSWLSGASEFVSVSLSDIMSSDAIVSRLLLSSAFVKFATYQKMTSCQYLL